MMDADHTRFSELMRQYDLVETALSELKSRERDLRAQKDHLRRLLRDEVTNMGLGPGSALDVPGVGKFSFTTERHYSLPAEYRTRFVDHLIGAGESGVLTVSRNDLKAWADDKVKTEQEIPGYLTYYEDKFVPRISLESSKARRRDARVRSNQGDNE